MQNANATVSDVTVPHHDLLQFQLPYEVVSVASCIHLKRIKTAEMMAPSATFYGAEIVRGKTCSITGPRWVVQHARVRAYELLQQVDILQQQRSDRF